MQDHFQGWEHAGFFTAEWQTGLSEYDGPQGIQWEWRAWTQSCGIRPFRRRRNQANPTDRGKRGSKRSLLTDGAGIPLAIVVEGANRHDVRLPGATLDCLVIS
jgi:putative transposase